MSAPIFAVNADGCAESESWMRSPIAAQVRGVAILRSMGYTPSALDASVLACVTRARTASAVAHEHARRVAQREYQLHECSRDAFCKHGEPPKSCWLCYVENQP